MDIYSLYMHIFITPGSDLELNSDFLDSMQLKTYYLIFFQQIVAFAQPFQKTLSRLKNGSFERFKAWFFLF